MLEAQFDFSHKLHSHRGFFRMASEAGCGVADLGRFWPGERLQEELFVVGL